MKEAGLESDAIQKRRQEESYRIIQEFENWMNSVSGRFTPKSRMGKALVYTYTLLPRRADTSLMVDTILTTMVWRMQSVL